MIENFSQDVYTYLQGVSLPIVMYGMGKGADKILSVFERYGIVVSDFFASDGFVRGHLFHGKRVLSYSEVCERYRDGFTVVMSFASSREDVLENVCKIKGEREFFLPDVPVAGDDIFTLEFFNSHKKEILAARALFDDEESLRIFDNVINYKLSGNLDYLFAAESNEELFTKEILHPERFRVCADLGAYNGDSIRHLLSFTDSVERIIAAEPDEKTFKKLCLYIEGENRCKIDAYPFAMYDRDTVLLFEKAGNRGSAADFLGSAKKSVEVTARCPDTLFAGEERLDYIKYDVEGCEYEALSASAETIKRLSPSMLISAYHKSEDIFALPLLAEGLCSASPFEYKFYLRRLRGVPAFDINLYAVSLKD